MKKLIDLSCPPCYACSNLIGPNNKLVCKFKKYANKGTSACGGKMFGPRKSEVNVGAYKMGVLAREKGKAKTACPYMTYIDIESHLDWNLGWDNEDARCKKKKNSIIESGLVPQELLPKMFSKKTMRGFVRPQFCGSIMFGTATAEEVEKYLDETFGKDSR